MLPTTVPTTRPTTTPSRAPSRTPTTSPTTTQSYCESSTYFDQDYSATVCAGMDFNVGNDLGSKTFTTFDVDACESYCFTTWSSAMGGFMVYSSSGSHVCWCKATMSGSVTQRDCWYGVGFYKGEGSDTAELSVAWRC
jgi:hypothetical protein